ncbi:hypothetical protein EDB86DRAFT_2890194 [Lactarius hatsudake]|nr:hypothetical protein EDB86DRAFT_2890194 [Lactarius hatsudake]
MREAGVRSLERSIGGIIQFKTVEWAAHVSAQGLAPSSLLAPLPSTSEASDTTARRWRGLQPHPRSGRAGEDSRVVTF